MLQRLYVHNFRCLENFELNLKDLPSSLLIGKNGAGKSTIAFALEIFQSIGRGDGFRGAADCRAFRVGGRSRSAGRGHRRRVEKIAVRHANAGKCAEPAHQNREIRTGLRARRGNLRGDGGWALSFDAGGAGGDVVGF